MANYESIYSGAQVDAGVGYGILWNTNKMAAATKAIFYQDTAPTTWTIENTLDDKLLFITKGSDAGGETGGGEHSTGTWTQPDHTLTIDEIPEHTHSYTHNNQTYWYRQSAGPDMGPQVSATSGSAGGGEAHNHGTTWRPAAYCAIIATKDAY